MAASRSNKLPKRVPKWAQGGIKETRTVHITDVGTMMEALQELPEDAYAEVETSYGECYGHEEMTVEWYRDHTPEEYHKERIKRRKEAKEQREWQAAIDDAHREGIREEAIKLGLIAENPPCEHGVVRPDDYCEGCDDYLGEGAHEEAMGEGAE